MPTTTALTVALWVGVEAVCALVALPAAVVGGALALAGAQVAHEVGRAHRVAVALWRRERYRLLY